MKKILLSIALIAVIFGTLSLNSCVKKAKSILDNVENALYPESLSGTTWTYSTMQGKIDIVFATTGNTVKVTISANGVETGGFDGTYTYSKGSGKLTDNEDPQNPYSFDISVSGRSLTIDLGEVSNGKQTYFKQ